jgi:hypothetical protein
LISFLTTQRHRYTLLNYLRTVPEQGRVFAPISYRELLQAGKAVGPGAVIFADIDRLPAAATARAVQLWESLRADPTRRVLNHPTRSMRRFELLRSRYQAGLSDFNVYRLGSGEMPQLWPVFLRNESEHDGPQSPLLRDSRALHEFESRSRAAEPGEQRLLVEFCSTADAQGVMRKYSAFRVGDVIVPRHVFFSSRRWCIKEQDLVTPELLAEERHYVETNPHQAELQSIFEQARIDYGRIDYAFKDGRIQVWEINTNPMLVRPEQLQEDRAEIHLRFCHAIKRAFAKLSEPTGTMRMDSS